jgi:hypothetical protein
MQTADDKYLPAALARHTVESLYAGHGRQRPWIYWSILLFSKSHLLEPATLMSVLSIICGNTDAWQVPKRISGIEKHPRGKDLI